jgi:hypothetical protein
MQTEVQRILHFQIAVFSYLHVYYCCVYSLHILAPNSDSLSEFKNTTDFSFADAAAKCFGIFFLQFSQLTAHTQLSLDTQ